MVTEHKQMNVLQIANGYLEKDLYRQLFTHLEKYGVHSHVFIPVKKGYDKKANEESVLVTECFNALDRHLFFPKQLKTIKAVKHCVDLKKFDVVHAHTLFSTGYTAYWLNKRYGIPYIVAVRNTDVNLFFKKIPGFKYIGLKIMRKASRIVFLSSQYRKNVLEKYIPPIFRDEIFEKTVILPNGIDDYFFDNAPKQIHELHSPLRIIQIGDIDYNKNITATMEAIELLNKEGNSAVLWVIGEIKDHTMEEQIQKKEYVRYLGKQSKEGVCAYLKQSDIFVMPSHHETFGLVYAEAISQGIPVVYTRGQGFDGQFEDGVVGYAGSDYDPNEIYRIIKKIMDDYPQISATCIEKSHKFLWNNIAQQYLDIYQKSIIR